MKKIPVYLLNGALGSGKTTLLKELLQVHDKKQFVIENEIAQMSVDDVVLQDEHDKNDIHTIAGECVCCSDGSSLVKALTAAYEQRFEVVFIESTGAASMAKLLVNLLGEAFFTAHFELRQAIYILDALAYQRKAPRPEDIAVADTIVVSKLDIIDEATRQSLKSELKSTLTKPVIFKDEPYKAEALLPPTSQAIQNLQEVIQKGLPAELHQPASTVLNLNKTITPSQLMAVLDPFKLERIKGFLATHTGTVRLEATTEHHEVTPYADSIADQAYLVLIDADKAKIAAARAALQEEGIC